MTLEQIRTEFALEDATKLLIELFKSVPSLRDSMLTESKADLELVSREFKFAVEFTADMSSLVIHRRGDGKRVLALRWQPPDSSVLDRQKAQALSELVEVLAFGRMGEEERLQ